MGISLFQIAFEKILPEDWVLIHHILLLLVAVVLVSTLLFFSAKIMLPPMKVIKNVYCKLLFNTETKRFINPGWYSSWYPAQLAVEHAIKV